MKVLLVKISSMGDIIHTLPALTDAADAVPGIRFDWVVEEEFAEIPPWHPAVDAVVPIALRRWRRDVARAWRSGEWSRFRDGLGARSYDAVIDAQGLLKTSLFVTRLLREPRWGLDARSAREPLAALFYEGRLAVPKNQHAVERTRQLFARALGYPRPAGPGRYGLALPSAGPEAGGLVFLHGTSRAGKHWPEPYWRELIARAAAEGWRVRLPWGSSAEHERARRLAQASPCVEVLPRLGLAELARVLAEAAAVVSVDTGLSHLAAALGRVNVALFGPTDAALVGAYGRNQVCLSAADFPPVARATDPPIFASLTPEIVWRQLQRALEPRPC